MVYQGIDRWNSPDAYLEHHGVKGMKWGVRRYEKLKNRTNKAFADVQSYDEALSEHSLDSSLRKEWQKKREKALVKANKLYKKEKNLESKIRYKDEKRRLIQEDKNLHKELVSGQKANYKDYRQFIKTWKKGYKNGQLDKESYKNAKKLSKMALNAENDHLENSVVIKAYNNQKALEKNKATYMKDIHGSESKQYKRGMKAYNRMTEHWSHQNSSYTITKSKDGKFKISRLDMYYYYY